MTATTVKVNLLPREIEERAKERRRIGLTAAALLAFIAVLAVLYVLKLGDVADATTERDLAQAEVQRLERELAQLQEFAELAQSVDTREQVLVAAMAQEVDVAGLLNDLSLSFPGTSSLTDLALTVEGLDAADPEAGVPPTTAGVDEGPRIGSITFQGYSIERYAPGVETLILQLETVPSFFAPYVTTAQDSERGGTLVTQFDGAVQIDDSAFTGRYAEGLPDGIPELDDPETLVDPADPGDPEAVPSDPDLDLDQSLTENES